MSVTPLQKALRKKILLEKNFDCPLRKERAYDPRFAAIVGSIVQSGAQSMIIRHRSRDCGRDIPPDSITVSDPCRVIRQFEPLEYGKRAFI